LQLETEYGVSTRPRGQSSSRRFWKLFQIKAALK
jgi:hypothetical protein